MMGLVVLHMLPRVVIDVKELGKRLELWGEVVQGDRTLLLQLHLVVEALGISTTNRGLLTMVWWTWMVTSYWTHLLLLETQILILIQDILEELLWVSLSLSVRANVLQICFESFAWIRVRERGIFKTWHRIEAVWTLTWTRLIFYDTAKVWLAIMNVIVKGTCHSRSHIVCCWTLEIIWFLRNEMSVCILIIKNDLLVLNCQDILPLLRLSLNGLR